MHIDGVGEVDLAQGVRIFQNQFLWGRPPSAPPVPTSADLQSLLRNSGSHAQQLRGSHETSSSSSTVSAVAGVDRRFAGPCSTVLSTTHLAYSSLEEGGCIANTPGALTSAPIPASLRGRSGDGTRFSTTAECPDRLSESSVGPTWNTLEPSNPLQFFAQCEPVGHAQALESPLDFAQPISSPVDASSSSQQCDRPSASLKRDYLQQWRARPVETALQSRTSVLTAPSDQVPSPPPLVAVTPSTPESNVPCQAEVGYPRAQSSDKAARDRRLRSGAPVLPIAATVLSAPSHQVPPPAATQAVTPSSAQSSDSAAARQTTATGLTGNRRDGSSSLEATLLKRTSRSPSLLESHALSVLSAPSDQVPPPAPLVTVIPCTPEANVPCPAEAGNTSAQSSDAAARNRRTRSGAPVSAASGQISPPASTAAVTPSTPQSSDSAAARQTAATELTSNRRDGAISLEATPLKGKGRLPRLLTSQDSDLVSRQPEQCMTPIRRSARLARTPAMYSPQAKTPVKHKALKHDNVQQSTTSTLLSQIATAKAQMTAERTGKASPNMSPCPTVKASPKTASKVMCKTKVQAAMTLPETKAILKRPASVDPRQTKQHSKLTDSSLASSTLAKSPDSATLCGQSSPMKKRGLDKARVNTTEQLKVGFTKIMFHHEDLA